MPWTPIAKQSMGSRPSATCGNSVGVASIHLRDEQHGREPGYDRPSGQDARGARSERDLVGALAGKATILMVASRRADAITTANSLCRWPPSRGWPYRTGVEARGLSRVGEGDTGEWST